MNYVNLRVFNKRNGIIGIVVSQDEDTLSVKFEDNIKVVTVSTFRRWYTIVPQDREAGVRGTPISDEKFNPPEENKNISLISGKPGMGTELRERFLYLVKEQANQKLDITYNDKSKCDTIKYNGRNVFECTATKKSLTVMCHPLSLTADNFKRATKVFPKEWGWSLRAKFVFTEINQWPLMKTIIADGLFYRQKENNVKNTPIISEEGEDVVND